MAAMLDSLDSVDDYTKAQTEYKTSHLGILDYVRELQDRLLNSQVTPETQLEIFKELNNISIKLVADSQPKPQGTKDNRR